MATSRSSSATSAMAARRNALISSCISLSFTSQKRSRSYASRRNHERGRRSLFTSSSRFQAVDVHSVAMAKKHCNRSRR